MALATKLGITIPAAVHDEVMHPGACEVLAIDSLRIIKGNHKTWQRAWITNKHWTCFAPRPEAVQNDEWTEAFPIERLGAWLVPHGGGILEIQSSLSIPYSDVSAIVRAMRSSHLANHPPPSYGGKAAPMPDASSIFLIVPDSLTERQYRVYCRGQREVLVLSVRGSKVEFRGWSYEIS